MWVGLHCKYNHITVDQKKKIEVIVHCFQQGNQTINHVNSNKLNKVKLLNHVNMKYYKYVYHVYSSINVLWIYEAGMLRHNPAIF